MPRPEVRCTSAETGNSQQLRTAFGLSQPLNLALTLSERDGLKLRG
jgi:hypothetical protein